MAVENLDFFQGHVPPVQRTMLEILPLLRPAVHLPSMWLLLLRELLHYLPRSDSPREDNEDEAEMTIKSPNGAACKSPGKAGTSSPSAESTTNIMASISSYLFAEKLIPVLVDLFLQAPAIEKYSISPEIVQGLGR